MNFLLVCVGGERKGMLWKVSGKPLVIGRNPECDIVLSSRSISRRHCQVLLREDTALIEDLGCHNLPLINGMPERNHSLSCGDDIQLGCEHFTLAVFADTAPVSEMAQLLPQTVNWEQLEAGRTHGPAARIRPRTVQDLALLYEAVSEFGGYTDPETLFKAVQRRLIEYFNPEGVWIARQQGRTRLGLCFCHEFSVGGNRQPVPMPLELRELTDACLQQNRTLLARNGVSEVSTGEALQYAAPVMFDGIPLAALAVQTRTSREVHPEGGLQFLTLLARSLGPILFSVEQSVALHRDNERLRLRTNESHTIIGDSSAMRQLRQQAMKTADTAINALITGETGVGKELVARTLHDFSPRRAAPLVIVNCAAIPQSLFESELFGHTKGAFTGAVSAGMGLLSKAHGGTLFLDEIGDLSLENQARILRVVENHSYRAIGATSDTVVDVRFVAATNKNLEAALRDGQFREDLYHRIRGLEIHVPPLREHLEDIPAMAEYFFDAFRDEARGLLRGFAPDVFDALKTRDWPGNVRELRNLVYRGITLTQTDLIELEDVLDAPVNGNDFPAGESPRLSLDELEKQHITQTLQQCAGNVRLAAKTLGISRTTLYNKINGYGIEA